MTDLSQTNHQSIVTALNATRLSRHLADLLRKEMVSVDSGKLVLVQLMDWASDNHYANQLLGEMEYGAVARAADNNPQALYDNLTDDRMLEAQTLTQASGILVSCLAEILD